jgi:hypothetical protein
MKRAYTSALITGPHILAVIIRPYPARADAVTPPAAVPEMSAVSTRDECTGTKFRRDTCTRSACAPSHNGCAWPAPSHDPSGPTVSAAEVCTATAEVCTATTAEVCTATAEVCTATTAEVCTATTDVPAAAATTTTTAVSSGSIGGK